MPHDKTEMDQDDREDRLGEILANRHVEGARALPVHHLNGSHDDNEAQEPVGGSHHKVPARIHDGVGRAHTQGRKPDEVNQWLNRATEPSQDIVQEIDNKLTDDVHFMPAFALINSMAALSCAHHEGSVAGALGRCAD